VSCVELCERCDVVGGLPVNSCQCCVSNIPSLSCRCRSRCLRWQLFALRYAAHSKSERTTKPQVAADAEAVAVAVVVVRAGGSSEQKPDKKHCKLGSTAAATMAGNKQSAKQIGSWPDRQKDRMRCSWAWNGMEWDGMVGLTGKCSAWN